MNFDTKTSNNFQFAKRIFIYKRKLKEFESFKFEFEYAFSIVGAQNHLNFISILKDFRENLRKEYSFS